EREEATINAMLGSSDGAEHVGPRAPRLPPVVRSMEARDFTLAAFRSLGVRVTPLGDDFYLIEESGRREQIRLADGTGTSARGTLYAPGSAAFIRLVDRVTATGVHDIDDRDRDPVGSSREVARRWIESFGAEEKST